MADKEMIEEKIGEAIGLEKAAQNAVDELDSRELLKADHMKKLSKMKSIFHISRVHSISYLSK